MIATKGGVGQYVAQGSDDIDDVTKAETTVAYWLTYHTLPMSAADEFSKMVRQCSRHARLPRRILLVSALKLYIIMYCL